MNSVRQMSIGCTAVLLYAVFALMSPSPARAAGDNCAVVGMFNARAKQICEAAARSSQNANAAITVNAANSYAAIGGPGAGDQDGAPVTPPSAPAPGFRRYDIAQGGLYVDLAENYPDSYGPAWKLKTTSPQPIVTDRYNRLNHGPQGTETLFVRIVDDQGRAGLEFARRATPPCVADILGLPQVVTGAPKRFLLTNFRYANNRGPQCQRKLASATPWQGWIALSADADGNLKLSMTLDLAMDSGQPWFEFTAHDLPFLNQMTPQMAVAEVDKKAQAAAAEQARAEEARKVMAARLEQRQKLTGVARLADQIIDDDSRSWLMQHYDIGSVVNAQTTAWAKDHVPAAVYAEYTHDNGQQGAVKISLNHDQSVKCIQFWNEGGCRPFGQPESHGILASAISNAMSSGSESSSLADQNATENARLSVWRNSHPGE